MERRPRQSPQEAGLRNMTILEVFADSLFVQIRRYHEYLMSLFTLLSFLSPKSLSLFNLPATPSPEAGLYIFFSYFHFLGLSTVCCSSHEFILFFLVSLLLYDLLSWQKRNIGFSLSHFLFLLFFPPATNLLLFGSLLFLFSFTSSVSLHARYRATPFAVLS